MRSAKGVALCLLLMCCAVAAGKKKKVILPEDVVQARTVLVMIDPHAGTALEDPDANRIALDNVESSILNWGRFTLATDVSNADLIIVVSKGTGRIVEPTIGGVPNNGPPVMMGRGPAGSSNASDPSAKDPTSSQPANPGSREIEAGQVGDMMAVYRGKRQDPLDSPAVWRHSAKDALEPPGVPAVDAFKKVIADAEKQQAKTP